MTSNLLLPEVQEFISENAINVNPNLALQKNPFKNITWAEILNQIAGKIKCKEKLPTWYAEKNILFPSKISVEQTSSEVAAEYKAELVSGNKLIDLTGGFGIDDYYFSKKTKQVVHCEMDTELSEIAKHNFNILNRKNIVTKNGNSTQILEELNELFDWIYIDPSRRNDKKGKVFMLQDCLPNVPENLNFYFNFSSNILIKTAPILDITAGLNELKNVKNIHIIAIKNEVKELLWEIEKNYSGKITIKTCNITKGKKSFFEYKYAEKICTKEYSLPQKYLYEPNAAILKSGGFEQVATTFSVQKLAQHSHLYTSEKIIDFPGRIFIIQKTMEYSNKNMKDFVQNTKANISTRNFPDTPENLKKKWKIQDGGSIYIFFTTNLNKSKIIIICKSSKKINQSRF